MIAKDLSTPDGSPAVVAANDVWDSVIAEGREFGDALPTDVSEAISAEATQPETGSSTEAGNGSSAAPQSAPAGDDGQHAAAPLVEAPAGDASAAGTTAPVETPAPVVDPLPFTYSVDGKDESIAGAMVIPGDGLYVPEKDIPHFKLAFSQAKTLDRQVQAERTQRKSENDQWDRLTTHRFKNDKGEDVSLSGSKGLEALRMEHLSDKTALSTVVAKLLDPKTFPELIDYVRYDEQGKEMSREMAAARDEHGRPIYPGSDWVPALNKDTWARVVRESSLTIREKRLALRGELDELYKPAPPAEPTVASFAGGSIEAIATEHGLTALTPADKQFLAAHFENYTRPATPQEQQHYGVPRLVKPEFVELMKDKNATRAEMATVAANAGKTQAVVGKAETFNKGMQAGKAPVAPAAVRRVAPVATPAVGKFAPKDRTEQTADDKWAALISQGMEAG